MKYNAFISYRHTPLDMEIAKKLHKALETYHIPKSVQKKTGKKRINRVFRDQEELPIGSDLNDNISAALKESEYLLVICSPNTPESYWVLKEIESFIELHDREHVLAVLIDGEPSESFPAPLLTDEKGNPVEPLAADIRGSSPKERDKKFKTEFLRLAAPLIGCNYDDLKQRHKERIIKRNIAIGASALGAVAAFGVFFGTYNAVTAAKMKRLAEEKAALADEKTRLAGEIFNELQQKQISQSKFYAEKSLSLLNDGKREDAVLVALEGLPTEGNERPLVSEAEYALSSALYAYGSDSSYQFDRELATDFILRDMVLNESETRLIGVDKFNNVYVWDTSTRERLFFANLQDYDEDSYSYDNINADENGVYVALSKKLLIFDYNGGAPKECLFDTMVHDSKIRTDIGKAVVTTTNTLYEVDLKSATILNSFSNPYPDSFDYEVEYSPEQNLVLISHDFEDGPTYASVVNTETGSFIKLPVKGNNVAKMHFSSTGKIVILSNNSINLIADYTDDCVSEFATDGTLLWQIDLDTSYQIQLIDLSFISSHLLPTADGEEKCRILVSVQGTSFTIDEESGTIVARIDHPSAVTGVFLYPHGSTAYMAFSNGVISPVNTETGLFYPAYKMETYIPISYMLASPVNNSLYILRTSSPGLDIMISMDGSDAEEFITLPADSSFESAASDGSYYVFSKDNNYYYYDNEGKEIFTYDFSEVRETPKYTGFWEGKTLIMKNHLLLITDPVAKEVTELSLEKLGITDSCREAHLSADTDTLLIYDTGRNFNLLDLNTLEIKKQFKLDESINEISFSPNAKTIFVVLFSGEIKALNAETGEEILLPAPLQTREMGVSFRKVLRFSENGTYFAYLEQGQSVTVLNTSDYSVAGRYPLYCSTHVFIDFLGNEDVLLIQGDDYVAYCYDLKTKKLLNSTGFGNIINGVLKDKEKGLNIIQSPSYLHILNERDYGISGSVPYGIMYFASTGNFIKKNGKSVLRVPYKNCDELISDAKKQFPDSELSEQKRIEYNIDQ